MLRTHSCGELNLGHKDEKVTLCGWLDTKRDHGSLVFLDLKDRYGITQCVIHKKESGEENFEKAKNTNLQSVIKIKGAVKERPTGTYNEEMATGKIEIRVEEFGILNESETLPFELEKSDEVSEELRLKYRYLNLRKSNIINNLQFKQKVFSICRDFLEKEGFMELETPLLTKSTPEGARDFLVPSRIISEGFYALPQSPQLFKQIFMVSGVDKYYQIVRCFRDEDLRADRQPEFTQLDLECSFVEEEDIIMLVESLFKKVFREVLEIDLEVPFPRLTYEEAMEKYNSDKPDVREEGENFAFVWVVDFPMFSYNKEEDNWELEHHPFTSPKQQDLDMIRKCESTVKARAYDLVLNGVEIGSGSIRIHHREFQENIFKLIGLEEEEYKNRFGFLLQALSLGAPPHGGIAFGIDRLIAIMCGCDTIRDIIPFPKTQKGICQLTGAPTKVPEEQIKELNLSYNLENGGEKKDEKS